MGFTGKPTEFVEGSAPTLNQGIVFLARRSSDGKLFPVPLDASKNLIVTLDASNSASTVGTHSNPSITTSSGNVLAANTLRKGLFIRSPTAAGTVTCRLHFGSPATVNDIELARGESYWDGGPNVYRGQITAITSSGTVVLEVVEFT